MANLIPVLLDNVYSTVQAGSSAIGSSSATGINVATGDGANFGTIGTNQYIPAVIVDTSTTPEMVKEYVWVTSRSTDALTVVRQAEESTRYAASTTTIQAGYVIAAVASRDGLYRASQLGASDRPFNHGLLAWNFDPILLQSGSATVSVQSGRVIFQRVQIPVTMTINNVLASISTAGSGLTSGQCLAGLYSSALAKLGASADQSTVFTSTGLKTIALSSPVTVTGGPGVWIYVAILSVGTTVPIWYGISTQGNVVGSQGLGLDASGSYRTDFQSGQTSLPTTASLGGGTTSMVWVGLS